MGGVEGVWGGQLSGLNRTHVQACRCSGLNLDRLIELTLNGSEKRALRSSLNRLDWTVGSEFWISILN